MIKVKFLGPLGRYQLEEDDSGVWLVEADGQKVADFLATTPLKDVKMGYSIMVNQKKQEGDYILQDGDALSVLPLFYAG